MLATGLSSLPCGPFHRAAWCLCNMPSAFLYGEWDAIYYNLASKATFHHFWNILLVTQASPIQCGRRLYSIQECKYQKAGTIEGYLGGWLWHSDLSPQWFISLPHTKHTHSSPRLPQILFCHSIKLKSTISSFWSELLNSREKSSTQWWDNVGQA